MKNATVQKINTMGKVGKILLIIMQVALTISIVACLAGSLIIAVMPKKDLITGNGTLTAEVNVTNGGKLALVDTPFLTVGGIDISVIEDIEKLDGKEFSMFDSNADFKVNSTEKDGVTVYNIETNFGIDKTRSLYYAGISLLLTGAVVLVIFLFISIFGKKLAKALETCDSPFEEGVIKAMKRFAYSLIPLGIFYLTKGGISLTGIILVIAVIVFSLIFSYGAELQRESDETL